MIKILYIHFVFCLIICSTSICFSQSFIDDKLENVRIKSDQGKLEESIKISNSYIKKNKNITLNESYAFAVVLNAKALAKEYRFAEATKLIQSLLSNINPETEKESLKYIYLHIGDYYFSINDIVKARVYLAQANVETFGGNMDRLKSEAILLESKILCKEGYAKSSIDKIVLIEEYRKSLFLNPNTSEGDQFYKNSTKNKNIYIQKYLECLLVKSESYIKYGNYDEASKNLNQVKTLTIKYLGKNHFLFVTSCLLQANLFEIWKMNNETLSAYLEAYNSNNLTETDNLKLKALVSVIKYYYITNDEVSGKDYLRKLQMYALRNVGVNEPIQMAYENAEAFKSFYENDFKSAKLRIAKLEKTFKYLPSNTPEKLAFQSLKSEIAFYEGDFVSFRKQSDSLSKTTKLFVGENCPSYHNTLLKKAVFETKYGKKVNDASLIFKNSYYPIVKNELLVSSVENLYYLDALSDFYLQIDKYDSALVTRQLSVNTTLLDYTQNPISYIINLTKLVDAQFFSGLYADAYANLEKASSLASKLNNEENETLISLNIQLANRFKSFGDITKSNQHLKTAKSYAQNNVRKHFITLLELNYQQATLYFELGSYYKSGQLLAKSIVEGESKLGKPHAFLNLYYLENAKLNIENGNYAQADIYINQSLSLLEPNSVAQADVLIVQADYFQSIFDNTKALQAASASDQIYKLKLGENHLKRAESLLKLATIKAKNVKSSTEEVQDLYTQALNIILKSLGKTHPLYADNLQKQAEYFITIGKLDDAEKSLNEAQKLLVARLGEKNINMAEIFSLLGNIYYKKENYNQAEIYFIKSKNLYNLIFNSNHPGSIKAQSFLARNYYMQNKYPNALAAIESIIPTYLDYTVKYFPTLSFRQKSKFWNTFKDDFEFYTYLTLEKSGATQPKLRGELYNMVISTKALLLSSDIKLRKSIVSSNDSLLISQFNEWISKKEILTQAIGLSKEQQIEEGIDIKTIENEIEKLEVGLSSKSSSFANSSKKTIIDWQSIKKTLAADEYAVEIIRYRTFNKTPTDSVCYAAMILSKNTNNYPDIVKIPEGTMLEKKYLKYYRNSVIYKSNDELSYNSFWQPIKAKIPDGSTIYLSSEGVYNQINIETMADEKGVFPIDKDQIVLVTNTKDLIAEKEKLVSLNANYILSGDATFYASNSPIEKKTIPSLPGTEAEINALEKTFLNNGINPTILTKENVTEDTIKALKNPRVFHIASHGYFKETIAGQDDELAINPLLNSGLMLTGSGDIADNKDNSYVNQKDGILTASEALDLNFDNTELVVLSACETGRGDVQVGEGVYGLQRSFLVAGSKAIILSLFKVNDEVTQKLMQNLYENWFKTGDLRKSFTDAKRKIKAEYPAPIFWGAFVMIESKPKALRKVRN